MDLFAEYKVLDMGERLGRFISQYRVEYFVPDQTNGPIVYSYGSGRVLTRGFMTVSPISRFP